MIENPSLIYLLTTLFSLLVLSGFFSGSETGMMASNKVKLKNLSKKPHKGAKRALELLKRPDQLLSTILVGNNFANILASAIVTLIMIEYFDGNVFLGSILLTIVILIFSEITPKTIAAIKPEVFATKSSFLLKGLLYIFRPLIILINKVSSVFLKLFNVSLKDVNDNDNLNTEELKTLLDDSGDLIPKSYRYILSSVLGMEELVVEDIMVPISEIIGIDLSKNKQAAKKIIESAEYTRLPIYEENIDNIVGILHLKDSNEFLNRYDGDVKDKLLKSYFVAQSTALMKQLKEFQIHDRNMIQGLITIEDIFKEIVGKFGSTNEIELDDDFIRLSTNSILTTGNYKIRDINKSESWNISEDSAKTINGLITEYLDFIPQASLCLEIGRYRFEVLEIEDNFISKVKIKREA
jgi:Mg2+/Co2+ transporter CorB